MRIILIVLLIISIVSCRRLTISKSHLETRDSMSSLNQVRIDTVEKLVEVKVTDTFDNVIILKEPCDSNGKLNNGFRQVFTNGSFSAEVVIENNEIKVHFKGAKTESRNETNRARSIQVDSSDKKVEHVVHIDTQTEIGASFWERFGNYILHTGYIIVLIALWEFILKPILKLIKL